MAHSSLLLIIFQSLLFISLSLINSDNIELNLSTQALAFFPLVVLAPVEAGRPLLPVEAGFAVFPVEAGRPLFPVEAGGSALLAAAGLPLFPVVAFAVVFFSVAFVVVVVFLAVVAFFVADAFLARGDDF